MDALRFARQISLAGIKDQNHIVLLDDRQVQPIERHPHHGAAHDDLASRQSIATGITGHKGRVHITFSPEITAPDEDARQLAQRIDAAILGNFRLFPVNHLAWEMWEGRDESLQVPAVETLFASGELASARAEWQRRLDACPAEYRPWLILQYANPVQNQYRLRQS